MKSYRIGSESLQVEFEPAKGGRVSRLSHTNGTDILVPMNDADFPPLYWPKAGGYPLLPYHNRIEGGQLHFDNKNWPIAPHPEALAHSLHGPAQCRPWRVVNATPNVFHMELDYRADQDWPWNFHAQQHFEVNGNRLTIRLLARNCSEVAMPAGLGWHPYFAGCESIEHDAAYSWQYREDFLPTGHRGTGQEPDLTVLPATAYLANWQHVTAHLQGLLRLDLTADHIFDHLVIHQPNSDYACIEPVTHLANGFNLAACGIEGTGMVRLEAGEYLSGSLTLAVSPLSE